MLLNRVGDSRIGLFLIQRAGWEGGRRGMSKPYSMDLRERVVAAVQRDGLSRRQAAARFGVGYATAINWLKRMETTGSVRPGQIGGHKPKTLVGEHRDWLIARCREQDFTLRGLVAELAESRGLKVDYRSVWAFAHAEGLTHKKRRWSPKSATAPTSRAGGRSGSAGRS
jgi:putative transposase